MPLLMGKGLYRPPLHRGKRLCNRLPDQKAGHVGAFRSPRKHGNAESVHRTAEILSQIRYYLRQLDGMVKHRVALAQALFSVFYRQKFLLLNERICACIVQCRRGRVVTCINPQKLHVNPHSEYRRPKCR